MRLNSPEKAKDFDTVDVFNQSIKLTDYTGNKVMLCFFRDAACPFCNFRIYELTHKYKAWKEQGIEIIAVFSSPANEVREHVARYPRPFRLVSDPELIIYNQYGVEKSTRALWKAMLFKLPTFIKGVIRGGRPRPNPHVTLVPADFLIDEKGVIVDNWYGRNVSDHIPIERIDAFITK